MEILKWKIVNTNGYWEIKVFTREFGWLDEKEKFKTFMEAGKYLQEYYGK